MKRNVFLLIFVLILALLGGCSTQQVQHFDHARLAQYTTNQLALDYYNLRNEKWDMIYTMGGYAQASISSEAVVQLENELLRRGISEDELALMRDGRIRVGMSVAGLYGAWGRPTEENRTVSQYGVHIQHVYESGHRRSYVYTDDGVVTSWQD